MSLDHTEFTATDLDASIESEMSVRPTINRTVAKPAPPAKTRKTKQKTVTLPKDARKTGAKAKADREALRNVTNLNARDDSTVHEDAEEHDGVDDTTRPATKKTKSRKGDNDAMDEAPAKKKQRVQKTVEVENASDIRTTKARSNHKSTPTIPETQPVIEPSQTEVSPQQETRRVDRSRGARNVESARSTSMHHHVPARAPSATRHFSRERSVSDINRRLADSDVKRKLSDMTAKYDDMKLRYEQLAELGRENAESNFDKLKNATDEKAKNAADLIASLRKELSESRRSATTNTTEVARQQSQLAAQQTEIETLKAEHKTSSTSLLEAQNEIKSLNAKLEATRKAADVSRTPAAKERAGTSKSAPPSSTDANEAYLKEELYRDLTGLIINSVKRKDDENEFSCIQTGRNGTLHFHLKVSQETNPKTPSAGVTHYDETTFAYEPFLDKDRDRDLLDILPDYLVEEIDFPRSMATKFHFRLVEKMTAKIELED